MLLKKILQFVFSMTLVLVWSFDSPSKESGKQLYEKHCVKCHGDDGAKGKFKAKDLRYSRVADSTIISLLNTGKKMMPSYAKKMTIGEMKSVLEYTKSLRN